jgi:hypothetical protein
MPWAAGQRLCGWPGIGKCCARGCSWRGILRVEHKNIVKKSIALRIDFAKVHVRFPFIGVRQLGETINRQLFFLWLDKEYAFD